MTPSTTGSLDFATPVVLFQSPLAATLSINQYSVDSYSVAKDGRRFLFIRPRETAVARPPVTVVMNWAAGLKRE